MAEAGSPAAGRPPWWWRYRIWILILTLTVVVGGVLSTYLTTKSAPGDAEFSLVGLSVFALPSLLVVTLTRYWRVWIWECGLALVAWAMFLPGIDLSCTDCAFALLLPLNVAVPQAILVVVGLPRARNSTFTLSL